MVGAPGKPVGVKGLEAADGSLNPTAFLARATNVYVTPLVSPVTETGEKAAEAVIPPGLETTSKDWMEAPPLLGMLMDTDAAPLNVDTPNMVGLSGTVGNASNAPGSQPSPSERAFPV